VEESTVGKVPLSAKSYKVPSKDWNVEFAGDKVFSSIKTYPSPNPSGKTLVITGDYVFSNLEVFYI
jgi:hypothetical protein